MKKTVLLSLSLLALASASFADDALVTDVTARQRWPWSPTVDVSYVYNGGDVATSVWFTATWRGQSEPVAICSLESSGAFLVTNGVHRFSWDPVAAGYGAKTLVDFKVQATVTNAYPYTYLVVDLANGGYTTMAEPPAGGWTDEYKTTKLVFRRIPAGTYVLGTTEQIFRNQFGSNGIFGSIGRGSTIRTITYSSDFYFQVFAGTGAYRSRILDASSTDTGKAPSTGASDYADWRGATLDDGTTAVNWPVTGHQVASSSWVGKLRARTAATGQPRLLADLPTDAQWQLAMSAGENTFYPTGGVPGDSAETITNCVRTGFWTKSLDGKDPNSYEVGQKPANRWGIYDFNVRGELVLDWSTDSGSYVSGSTPYFLAMGDDVDPVGPQAPTALGLRLRRGGSANGQTYAPSNWTLFQREGQKPEGTLYNAPRFVINLKPIVE